MPSVANNEQIVSIVDVLNDANRPLKERFRALFTLRNLGGPLAIEGISRCFSDSSALLKHELAYCLGQMQDTSAIPALNSVLSDEKQEPMVRHEAGEALGAIGSAESLEILEKYSTSPTIEVAETCQLAVQRIKWVLDEQKKAIIDASYKENPYCSVDPTPAIKEKDTAELRKILLDESLPLFDRYRAMFALRNKGDDTSVQALADGLKCSSALFRHEIAFVLGQIQSPASMSCLIEQLKKEDENEMVRHECAEALGSIAHDECREILEEYVKDNAAVVKESCEVALDMCEYENSPEFQYADGLVKLEC